MIRVLITKALVVGGNANNGSKCGVSCAYSSNAFDNANTNNGARLAHFGEPATVGGSEVLS